MSEQFSSKRAPIRIEILSSVENTPVLDKDLHEIRRDASNSCEFSTRVMIECMVDEDEKERVWDLLRFKHKRDCSISSEPSELLSDTSSELITDFNDGIRVDGGL